MRKIVLILSAVIAVASLQAQDIVGSWSGQLKAGGMEIRLIFNVEKSGEGYTATMDSPDQGAFGIACDRTDFSENSLEIELKSLRAKYSGQLTGDSIDGTFTQMGMKFPLVLTKVEEKQPVPNRPQEPQPPYLYYTDDVFFENKKENIRLAGTLTLPSQKGKWPVVVLISGSGPQDRNEEIMGHKPFLVIADYLTKNGIGVLRFDDRGTAESGGDFASATSENFANDVEAAVEYLLTRKEVNKKKIALMGHSEGGIIAPMVAARNKKISAIVLLAGTGVRGDELLLMQANAIGKASGLPDVALDQYSKINRALYDIVLHVDENSEWKEQIADSFAASDNDDSPLKGLSEEQKEQILQAALQQLDSPWLHYFIKHDPAPVLQKVKVPVLAINGSLDLQVPAKENLSAIEIALKQGKNKKHKIVELEGLNHLFQEASTGLPTEYGQFEQTFSPKALEVILEWIKEIF